MTEFKYLHVMTHRNSNINGGIIGMMKENPDYFVYREHLFIVTHKDLKQRFIDDYNVVYVPGVFKNNYLKFLAYAKKADVIFLHQNNIFDFIRFIFTPKTVKRKFFWCVWGHDLYRNNTPLPVRNLAISVKHLIKLVLIEIGRAMIDREIKLYKGIGVGFKYDALEIKKRFQDRIKIYQTPYVSGLTTKVLDSVMQEENNVKKEYYRVMIGHSAHPHLNHMKILETLSRYKEYPICISLVLVYGNLEYAKAVENYAIELFGIDKVEIKSERMSIEEYVQYLNGVDVAIFDQQMQSALGNIYELLYLKKKLFINANGFLKTPFELEGLYMPTTTEIDSMTFEQFVSNDESSANMGHLFSSHFMEHENRMKMWQRTLYRLEKNI